MHRLRILVALSAALALPSPISGQEENTGDLRFVGLANGAAWRAVAVAGCRDVALVLTLDARGLAREPLAVISSALGLVLGTSQTTASEERAKLEAWQPKLTESAIHVATVVPLAEAAPALRRLRAALLGEAPWSDEAVVVAISRSRLAADDAMNVLPGPVLEAQARHELGLAPMSLGAPERYAMTVQEVRGALAELARPERASLVVVGGGDVQPLVAELAELRARGEPASRPATRAATAASAPRQRTVRPHAHIDAPFVSVAFAAPDSASEAYVPFLVAVEIVRMRAVVAFRNYRGGEAQARFPFVAFDPWEGSPLVAIQRRGNNGDEAEGPASELRAFLQRLRTEPAQPEEVARAGVALGRSLWLPPYSGGEDSLRKQPRLLLARAVTLAAARARGWPADLTYLVQKVDVGVVRRVLAESLAPERLVWSTLVPVPPLEGSDKKR